MSLTKEEGEVIRVGGDQREKPWTIATLVYWGDCSQLVHTIKGRQSLCSGLCGSLGQT